MWEYLLTVTFCNPVLQIFQTLINLNIFFSTRFQVFFKYQFWWIYNKIMKWIFMILFCASYLPKSSIVFLFCSKSTHDYTLLHAHTDNSLNNTIHRAGQ